MKYFPEMRVASISFEYNNINHSLKRCPFRVNKPGNHRDLGSPGWPGMARNSAATLRGNPKNGLTEVPLCTIRVRRVEETAQLTQSRISISIHEERAAPR